jgi:propionyl-CoA carboxylase alpha chain
VHAELLDQGYTIGINGVDYHIDTDWQLGEPLFVGRINDRPFAVQVDGCVNHFRLRSRGAEIDAHVLSPRAASLSPHMLYKEPADMSKYLLSPMPGLLVSLAVAEGEEVKEGQELAVVEAMKMENSLRALQDGVVASVNAEVGASLAVDEIIIEFA